MADRHYNIEGRLGSVALAFDENTSNGAATGVIGDEAEANARLIAAAPGLLAACEAALRHHQGGHSEIGAILRAAIAKAVP
jgi:hypothetical protein